MTDGIFLPTKIDWSGFCRLQLAFVLEKRKKVMQAGDLSEVGYRRSDILYAIDWDVPKMMGLVWQAMGCCIPVVFLLLLIFKSGG